LSNVIVMFFSRLTERLEIDMESLISSTGLKTPQQRQEQEENDQQQLDVCSLFPSLSFQERLGGCIGCMILGYLISFGSFFRFKDLLLGKPIPFVLFSTMGNVISLCGSCFLSGLQKQISKMWHPTRRGATGLYIGSLLVTVVVMLVFEFLGKKKEEDGEGGYHRHVVPQAILLVLLLLCQYVAVAWYCLSYIPFARRLATKFFSRLVSQLDEIG